MPRYTISPAWIAVLAGGLFVATADNAYASYLDPGTGSYLLQVAIGAALAAAFAVKTYWARIKGFLLRGQRRSGDGTDE